jgi:hypothetical protein
VSPTESLSLPDARQTQTAESALSAETTLQPGTVFTPQPPLSSEAIEPGASPTEPGETAGGGQAEPGASTPTETVFEVRFHPDGPLYQGDRVSMEVIPTQDAKLFSLKDHLLRVSEEETGKILGEAAFERFGIGGRQQATLTWVWDTTGLAPGEHELVFSLEIADADKTDEQDAGGHKVRPYWTETVILLPFSQVPYPEPQARWETVTSDCCIYHFITGSEAARDLEELIEAAEQRAQDVRQQLKTDFEKKVAITFLPRVLGHGGFAGEEISISYLDRNYAGGSLERVLHHEMVHILDSRIGGELRPSLFVEGFAVYLSGGHFKVEPLLERAAALLTPAQDCVDASQVLAGQATPTRDAPVCRLDRYYPLRQLMDNFYFSQHEIGYLQAGALVEYMVNRWGWEAFDAFYRDIQPIKQDEGGAQSSRPSDSVDLALQAHFNLTLEDLEENFKAKLLEVALTAQWVEDVRLVVAFYDTVRRYQQALDPSAYFLYAWLPGNRAMREAGIVADYLRRPVSTEHITIESILVQADVALQQGQYLEVQRLLDTVNQQLDRHP